MADTAPAFCSQTPQYPLRKPSQWADLFWPQGTTLLETNSSQKIGVGRCIVRFGAQCKLLNFQGILLKKGGKTIQVMTLNHNLPTRTSQWQDSFPPENFLIILSDWDWSFDFFLRFCLFFCCIIRSPGVSPTNDTHLRTTQVHDARGKTPPGNSDHSANASHPEAKARVCRLRPRPLARSLPETLTASLGSLKRGAGTPWKFGDSELENPPFFRGICWVLRECRSGLVAWLCLRKCGDTSATLKNCQQVRQVCVYLCPWWSKYPMGFRNSL